MATAAIAQSGDGSGDGSGQVQIQVTECGDGGSSSADCGGPTQVIDATPSKSQKTVHLPSSNSNVPAAQPKEVQSYSLKTGKGTVTTDDGSSQAGSIKLDSSVKQLEQRADAQPAPAAPTLPTVQTNAGSPFAGFGSGFQFVSSDEALARFAIPPFLQPIYQAAGRAYGVPWNVLAAINSIETDFGRLQNQVSSAGALGWMQFMPGTWKRYGVDASGDGVADPWNPVDAIYAAARYLRAAGAATDLRGAILAYNHAGWYADTVLKTAGVYGSLPSGLVAESGSLAFGRFPLRGAVSYGDDFRAAQAAGRRPDGLRIDGADNARAIATQNVTVRQILLARPLAAVLERRHRIGDRGVTKVQAAPLPHVELPVPAPNVIAAAGAAVQALTGAPIAAVSARFAAPASRAAAGIASAVAHAARASVVAPDSHGLPRGYGRTSARDLTVVVADPLGNTYRYEGLARLQPGIRPGAKLRGGQAIGFVGAGARSAMTFAVRAAGGAAVDPRPLVDGYRLQEAAGFQHVATTMGTNPFVPSAGLVAAGTVSGSDRALARRVLDDPGISIYPCGIQDIERGDIDRRVLGALLYLRKAGLTLTVTSLHCGHSYLTAGGNVSAHSYGSAVDIAAFNGQPVAGHQGPGSLTEQAIKLLMQLKGDAEPAQLISLMTLGGPSFALPDHWNHLHVGYSFQPALGMGRSGDALGKVVFGGGSLLSGLGDASREKASRGQELALSRKLGAIRNPKVRRDHGAGSITVEGETATDATRAERLAARTSPLRAIATAAGADVADVAVAGPVSLAVGTVAGAGHRGWAPHQTVLLNRERGRWAILGAPVDARGRTVNPRLSAIAALANGRGYAVGDRGAIVLVRPHRAPLVLSTPSHADLRAVAARRVAGHALAFAAGDHGRVVRLSGVHAYGERAGGQTLRALAISADGAAVAMSSPAVGSPTIYRRTAGSWHGSAADFSLPDGAGVTVSSLADEPSGLWAAGGITNAAASGDDQIAPFVAQLRGGHWTTWCAGSPALTAVRELGAPTPRTCDSELAVDPARLGPAGDVAATSLGMVVSTPAGLELHGDNGFRLIQDPAAGAGAAPVTYTQLALDADGSGWGVGAHGAMARVARAADAAPAAALDPARSTPRPQAGWSIEPGTGALVQSDGQGREASAGVAAGVSQVLRALSGVGVNTDAGAGEVTGMRSLDFEGGDGMAVGDHGQVLAFSDGRWAPQGAPTDSRLDGVAVRDGDALVGGADGTLVDFDGHSWTRSAAASSLIGDADVTAVDLLGDGTSLASAGGAIIARLDGGDWQPSGLQPLGTDVVKLRGYRDAQNELHALALVRTGATTALLDGDRTGWRSLGEALGVAISDFDLDQRAGVLSVVGRGVDGPVTARLRQDREGTWAAAG